MARRRDFEALAAVTPAFADVDPEDDGFDESTVAAVWAKRASTCAGCGSRGAATLAARGETHRLPFALTRAP